MTAHPKQIVIDKSVFQGIGMKSLCDFAKQHWLVLPRLLYAEIVTNPDEQERGTLLRRFQKVMLSGAYWCSSIKAMIEKEGQTGQAYGFLTDLDETLNMRNRFHRGQAFSWDHAGDAAARNLESAGVLLKNHNMVVRKLFPKILEEAFSRRQELEACPTKRFQFWIDKIDQIERGIWHSLGAASFGHLAMNPDRFCLSEEWVSWQYVRLCSVLDLEYSFFRKGVGGNSEHQNAEHDLHDVEYVVLLSRADGILMRDKKFIELARVAFPAKRVFLNVEEVPTSYRREWKN